VRLESRAFHQPLRWPGAWKAFLSIPSSPTKVASPSRG
jgi:hypothetical protein